RAGAADHLHGGRAAAATGRPGEPARHLQPRSGGGFGGRPLEGDGREGRGILHQRGALRSRWSHRDAERGACGRSATTARPARRFRAALRQRARDLRAGPEGRVPGHRPDGRRATQAARGQLTMAMTVGASDAKVVAPQMNVTPLVDIVLVLLIIFMVITPLLTKTFWVHTPKQEKEEVKNEDLQNDPSPPLVLRVRAGRAIDVNGT